MHEMGIVQGILAASCEAAERSRATRIIEIRVTIGELTEVVDEALHFAFQALAPETPAAGATLVVTRVQARSRCAECGTEFEHGRFDIACPGCGSYVVELLAGRELLVDSIEIDTPDDADADRSAAGTVAGAADGSV
jgi:hydrogenase nickel incorporation protein HypA/HybF